MSSGFQSTDELLDEAIALIEEKDFEAALPLLARIVAFEPEREVPYALWVLCHVRLERHQRALELADAGLAKGLARADLHLQKAEAYRALGRFDDSVAASRAALEADPDMSEAVVAEAAAEIAAGRHDAALQVCIRRLRERPQDEDVRFSLIVIAGDMERPDLVVEHAREYLRRFGKRGEVLSRMGHAYADQRDYRRADRAFRDAAQLEPEELDHHLNVVMNLMLMGELDACDRYVDRLQAADPDLADSVIHEVDLLMGMIEETKDP